MNRRNFHRKYVSRLLFFFCNMVGILVISLRRNMKVWARMHEFTHRAWHRVWKRNDDYFAIIHRVYIQLKYETQREKYCGGGMRWIKSWNLNSPDLCDGWRWRWWLTRQKMVTCSQCLRKDWWPMRYWLLLVIACWLLLVQQPFEPHYSVGQSFQSVVAPMWQISTRVCTRKKLLHLERDFDRKSMHTNALLNDSRMFLD